MTSPTDDTKTTKYGTEDAFYDLMGARLDIERTKKCDAVCLRTIIRVEAFLGKKLKEERHD